MSWFEGGVEPEAQLDRAAAAQVLRRTAALLRGHRRRIGLAVVVLVGQTACLLAGPALVRYGVDRGLTHRHPAALDRAAILYVVVAVVGLVLGRAAIWLVNSIGERFLRELRERAFRHLMGQGMDFFEREKTGRLVSRMTADIDALQDLTSQGLVLLVQNALIFVGAVVVIVGMSWELALCTLVIVPPLVWASNWFRRESNRAYLTVRRRIGDNLSTLQEGLDGVRVVQAYGRQKRMIEEFRSTNEAQYEANIDAVKISCRYFPFVEWSGVLGIAVVVGIGGLFVDQGIVTVGTVLAFVLYLNNLFEPIQQLSQLYNTVQSAGAALKKVFTLLDTPRSLADRPGARELPAAGALEVDGVSFAYGGGPPDTDGVLHPRGPLVLRDVALTVAAGERVALVGPTGAGKSTLAKLMVRFYDPVAGAVRFGGVDLRDATAESVRRRIVVVPQEGFLFSGTVGDNVRAARPDADGAAVARAFTSLGLDGFVRSLPDGLDTEVRERGSRLSAGEKQLVSLARAALADPAVLVLDEATSSLDPGTERAVEDAFEELTHGRSVVVVAHRLSTARRCDRIAVVDAGGVVEIGTHDELVDRGGHYAALFRAWSAGVAGVRGQGRRADDPGAAAAHGV